MAVTTTITSAPQYMRNGDNIPGCIGGGSDYRTIGKGTTETEMLFVRGFFGDNISSACKIQSLSVHAKFSCSRPDNKEPYSWQHGNARYSVMVGKGSVSGTLFTLESGTWDGAWSAWTGNLSYSWKEWNALNVDFSNQNRSARDVYAGISCELKHDASSNFCVWVGGVSISVTRTRACYITFKGDSIAEKTTMYDYGTVPSFGSTPTREGYVFKGWSNGSATYTGTLPTAYEQDVTYTAVWEKAKVPCTITYNGNGATGGSVAAQSGYANEGLTLAQNGFEKNYKVYFNKNDEIVGYLGYKESKATFQGWYTAASGGTKAGDAGGSYTPAGNTTLYAHWSAMSAVPLDAPEMEGFKFLGWYTTAEGGTKAGDGGESYTPSGEVTLYAHWEEIIVPPEIVSVAITYGGAQVSAQNKIPAGEGYLIAVGIGYSNNA